MGLRNRLRARASQSKTRPEHANTNRQNNKTTPHAALGYSPAPPPESSPNHTPPRPHR